MLKCSPQQVLNAGQQAIWEKVTGSYVYAATLPTLQANLASWLIQDFPPAQVGAGLGGDCAGGDKSNLFRRAFPGTFIV